MGADSLAKNTPNAPEIICQICLPKPQSSGFQWKKASLVVPSPCFDVSTHFISIHTFDKLLPLKSKCIEKNAFYLFMLLIYIFLDG